MRLASGTTHSIQQVADRRGHGHKTRYAMTGAAIGAGLGTLFGPLGIIMIGASVGAALGAKYGESIDGPADGGMER